MKVVKTVVEEHMMIDPLKDLVDEFMRYGSVEDRIKFLGKSEEKSGMSGTPIRVMRIINTINGDIGLDVNKDVLIVKQKPNDSLEFEVMSRENYEQKYTEQ